MGLPEPLIVMYKMKCDKGLTLLNSASKFFKNRSLGGGGLKVGPLSRGSPVATDGLPGWTLTVCLMNSQTHLNSDAVLG